MNQTIMYHKVEFNKYIKTDIYNISLLYLRLNIFTTVNRKYLQIHIFFIEVMC